jgi:hypothetical protein
VRRANKALQWTAIPLPAIAAGELRRYVARPIMSETLKLDDFYEHVDMYAKEH